MRFAALLLPLLASFFCACQTVPTYDDRRRELRAQLHTVVVEDGINSQEANIIAQSYLLALVQAAALPRRSPTAVRYGFQIHVSDMRRSQRVSLSALTNAPDE